MLPEQNLLRVSEVEKERTLNHITWKRRWRKVSLAASRPYVDLKQKDFVPKRILSVRSIIFLFIFRAFYNFFHSLCRSFRTGCPAADFLNNKYQHAVFFQVQNSMQYFLYLFPTILVQLK